MSVPNKRRQRRTSGSIRELPSGRFQARLLVDGVRYSARTPADGPLTFSTRKAADAWISRERTAVENGTWVPPRQRAAKVEPEVVPFGAYADAWLATRPLATRTRDLYASLLENRIKPTFGELPIASITPEMIRRWSAEQIRPKTPKGKPAPTAAAHAYSLAKSIFATAVQDNVPGLVVNPCRVKGASQTRRAKEPAQATLGELASLRAAMPEHHRAAIDLALWCSLRIGEVTGLHRADVDLSNRVVLVRRSVGRAKGGQEIKAPKSSAGVREVTIPSNIVAALEAHLEAYAVPGRAGWVFPAGTDRTRPLSADVLREAFEAARAKIGRPDLRFHDLRAEGATMAARVGATVAELQARLGHATPNMAMKYQRVAQERPREIADRLAALAADG